MILTCFTSLHFAIGSPAELNGLGLYAGSIGVWLPNVCRVLESTVSFMFNDVIRDI
jgi:hypothetical protein